MGVLTKYATKKVLHFNHNDFMMALRADLTPLLGNTGLWVIKNYMTRQTEKGNEEKKKRARTVLDIIQNYLDNGMTQLSRLNKFNMMNKFGPKKMPDQVVKRSDQILYSWNHYAPQAFFEDIKKAAEIVNKSKSKGTATASSSSVNKCDYCGAPEPSTIPHKRCS